MSRRLFLFSMGIVTLSAFLLRLYHLGEMFLWHDEAVNAFITRDIVESFTYHYHYRLYHGPSLFYLDALITWLFGFSEPSMRIVVVVAGTLLVASCALLEKILGRGGALFSALGLSLAPLELYYSRVGIHEMLFVLFSAGFMAFSWRYLTLEERNSAVWPGRMALFCLGGMFATKETVVLFIGAMVCASFCAWLWGKGPLPPTLRSSDSSRDPTVGKLATLAVAIRRRSRSLEVPAVDKLAALAAAIRMLYRREASTFKWSAILVLIALILLYSSFFTFPTGIAYFFAAYFAWIGTSVEQTHLHQPFYYFLDFLLKYYWPFLAPAIGAWWIGWKEGDRSALFLGGWSLSIIAAYSIIPYKTPWCALNLGLPLIWSAGYGIKLLLERSSHPRLRAIIVLGTVVSLLPLGARAREIAYRRYDDASIPFIWAPTLRNFSWILHDMEELTKSMELEKGKRPRLVLWHNKHPLYFYLLNRGYPEELLEPIYGRTRDKFAEVADAELVVTVPTYIDRARKVLLARDSGTLEQLPDKLPREIELSPAKRLEFEERYMLRRYPDIGKRQLLLIVSRETWESYERQARAGEVEGPGASLPEVPF